MMGSCIYLFYIFFSGSNFVWWSETWTRSSIYLYSFDLLFDLALLVVTRAVHGERDESGAGWYWPGFVGCDRSSSWRMWWVRCWMVLTWLCWLWQEQFMENVMSQVLDGIDLALLVVTGAVHGERVESDAGWYWPGFVGCDRSSSWSAWWVRCWKWSTWLGLGQCPATRLCISTSSSLCCWQCWATVPASWPFSETTTMRSSSRCTHYLCGFHLFILYI